MYAVAKATATGPAPSVEGQEQVVPKAPPAQAPPAKAPDVEGQGQVTPKAPSGLAEKDRAKKLALISEGTTRWRNGIAGWRSRHPDVSNTERNALYMLANLGPSRGALSLT